MEPLFDKPFPELREAFVRARFAEPAMFGRPDIESWLEEPLSRSSEPWGAMAYHDWLDRSWKKRMDGSNGAAGLLVTYATPFPIPPTWFLEGMDYREEYIRLLLTFGSFGHNPIFYPHNKPGLWPVVCLWPKLFVPEFKGQKCILGLRPANTWDIHRVFYGEMTENRPRAAMASSFLQDQYGKALQSVRRSAERDFDKAAAVSYDGKRIVNAKWVVVVSDSIATLYPGSAFYNRKAKLCCPSRVSGIRYPMIHDDCEQIHAFLSSGKYQTINRFRRPLQDYVVYNCGLLKTGFKLLFIHEYLCPSPLPEDGLEIKV